MRRIWSFLTYLWSRLCSVNRSCRKGFRPCYNHRCVANSRFCDGIDDCGDNSDEAYCGSESYSFDLTFKLPYVSGQDPAPLMLKWIWHTRPHAVPSLHCLMSTKIIKSTNSKRLLTPTLKSRFESLVKSWVARLIFWFSWWNNLVKVGLCLWIWWRVMGSKQVSLV